ncbi:unnamed protein product [Rhizophagus irregularis]|uniref:Uncharacterized protein n=1 Tax=Rhizophagus irregularis TaxID=588596 RepID=A0A2I1ELI8_9GLOM|nr:hypothetical protein RhiirB3_437038 [Rhizophagus irregularis]CAB5394964.1 unnamed protein product [Rhizophagus irregularis]
MKNFLLKNPGIIDFRVVGDFLPGSVYDKNALSDPMLVVRDHNEQYYRVFHSRKHFWRHFDKLPQHSQCFSEAVYDDLPQCPKIHVEFSSPYRFPGTEIVAILKQILHGILEVFRISNGDNERAPKTLEDLVLMDECGQDSSGFWVYYFHIQAPFFSFADHKEAQRFLSNVLLNVPPEVRLFIKKDYSHPVHFVRTMGSTFPGETLNKKISAYSRFLGTIVEIDRNSLFVKQFPSSFVSSGNKEMGPNHALEPTKDCLLHNRGTTENSKQLPMTDDNYQEPQMKSTAVDANNTRPLNTIASNTESHPVSTDFIHQTLPENTRTPMTAKIYVLAALIEKSALSADQRLYKMFGAINCMVFLLALTETVKRRGVYFLDEAKHLRKRSEHGFKNMHGCIIKKSQSASYNNRTLPCYKSKRQQRKTKSQSTRK